MKKEMGKTLPEIPEWKKDYVEAMVNIIFAAERVMTEEDVNFLGRFLWAALNRDNRRDKQATHWCKPKKIMNLHFDMRLTA